MDMTKPCDLIAVIQALYTRLQAGETPPPWPELEQLCHQTPEDVAPAVLRDPRIQAIRPALQAARVASAPGVTQVEIVGRKR